ncbi:MAG: thiamine diphosphokinase [Chloroflexi bacterium]|jgi:thiamine pyrophosphokinase|nr:thiamine diphosphokinase [Chloroflexota bacterium]
MKSLIVADGALPERSQLDRVWPGWDAGAELILAADGGVRKALALGLLPDLVLGDGDSLDRDTVRLLGELRIPCEPFPAEKDQSDLELCLDRALDHGATELVVLAALGGRRVEHALANVLLLALPRLAGCSVVLGDGVSTVRLVGQQDGAGDLALYGEATDYVSLLPLEAEVEGVRTRGLRYALRDESLVLGPSRGLSNELTDTTASVAVRRGRLLVVHTRRRVMEVTRS